MPRYHQPLETPQEEQLSRLLQLAQFAHLVGGQQTDQQQLEQQDQHQRVQAAIALLGLQQQQSTAAQTAKNEDAQRELQKMGIDVQKLGVEGTIKNEAEQRALQKMGIEEVAKNREATVKGNVADALISHFSADPANHGVLAAALEGLDFPQLAKGFQKQHDERVQNIASKYVQQYNVAKDKPGYLNAIKSDPSMTSDIWAALEPHLPKGTEAPQPTAQTEGSIGTKLGTSLRGVISELSPSNVRSKFDQAGKDFDKKNTDFWSALLNKQPQSTQ